MMKSSMGYHTLSVFQRLTVEEESSLNRDFLDYKRKSRQIYWETLRNKKKQVIGEKYTYENITGIRWLVLNMVVGNNFRIYGVMAIITPKVLLNKDYIAIASESDIQAFKSVFNNEARKISPILEDFDSYSMSRSDYCANFDLEELKISCKPDQKMKLIKMGDIPIHYAERIEYNKTSHRQKTDENSFYLISDSVVINCYNKYPQLVNDQKHPCPYKEDAKNLIRFEIQCKNRKLHAMSKSRAGLSTDLESSVLIDSDEQAQEVYEFYRDLITRQKSVIPIDAILSDAISSEMIDKYFRRIVRSGDYYTLAKARQMIKIYRFHPKKEKKLINALVMTNDHRGIYKTKLKLKDNIDLLLDYKQQLNTLDKLRINPVTIPRDWGIEHIPNLLSAYYDKCAEVQNEERRREGERRLLSKKKKGA
jgi:hypothetical protein